VALFDSWSSFTNGVVAGLEDLGGFVSSNLGTITGAIFGTEGSNAPPPPPPPGTGQTSNQQAAGFDLPALLSAFGFGGPTAGAPTDAGGGIPVGTMMLVLAGLVVVVLVKKA